MGDIYNSSVGTTIEYSYNEEECGFDWIPLSPSTMTIQTVLLYAILIVGVTTNGAVLSVIALTRELRTSTNNYVVVLCAANMVMLSTFVPLKLSQFKLTDHSSTIANLYAYLLQFYSNVSISALVILSFNRWRVVVKPMLNEVRTVKGHVFQVIIVFGVTAIITLPWAFSFEETHDSVANQTVVQIRYDYLKFTTYYGAIILYMFPLFLFGGFYVSMAWSLLSHSKNIRESIRRHKRTRAMRGRVAWIVLALVISFALCWLPHNLFLILYVNEAWCKFPKLINFLFHWRLLAYTSNTCTDPLCVFLLGSRYRKHLIRRLHLGHVFGYTSEEGVLQGATHITPNVPYGRNVSAVSMKLQSLTSL